jgi:NADH:ubiquinone oxidoreductase subunit H
VIKLMFKEELRPAAADPWLFALAPIISATAAFAAFAVVPFGQATTLFGLLSEPLRLQVADVNVAVLVIFAIASMSVWHRARRLELEQQALPLLGGLRSSAQMISYELSYGSARQRAGRRQLTVADRYRERPVRDVARIHPAVVPVRSAGRLPDLHDGRRG